jgi:hypothetical protein
MRWSHGKRTSFSFMVHMQTGHSPSLMLIHHYNTGLFPAGNAPVDITKKKRPSQQRP